MLAGRVFLVIRPRVPLPLRREAGLVTGRLRQGYSRLSNDPCGITEDNGFTYSAFAGTSPANDGDTLSGPNGEVDI